MPITDPDWVPPIELTFDVEKPIRSEQGLMLAGNPIAMAAGKPGAPRILGQAAASDRFGGLPVLTVSASDAYNVLQGHSPVQGNLGPYTGTEVIGITYTINAYTGSMRFKCIQATAGATSNSTLRLYKNGGLVTSFSQSPDVTNNRSVDVSVTPTDVIVWTHQGIYSTIVPSVTASNAYQPVSLYAPAVTP